MAFARAIRHLFSTRWGTRQRFTTDVRGRIEAAIAAVEGRHAGEIRFAVETAYDLPDLWYGTTPRERAVQVFGHLGVWDTADNNGVLIYVLMADRDVEIVADRAIAARVVQSDWDAAMPKARKRASPASASCSRGIFLRRAGIATSSRTRPSFSRARPQASVW
jgi:hypothetical protein